LSQTLLLVGDVDFVHNIVPFRTGKEVNKILERQVGLANARDLVSCD